MSEEEVVSIDRESQAIIEAIMKIAKDKADAIRKEAEKRAKEIIESAKREAEEILRSRRERAEREMREEISRRRSAAEVEANQIILRTKSKIVDELFRRIYKRLVDIADGNDPNWNYEEILERYSIIGANALGEKEVLLMGRGKDKDLLEKVAKKLSSKGIKASVDDRGIPTIGGVVVRDAKDEKRYYNTFDGRLRAYKEMKEVEIIEKLFGEVS